MNSKLIKIGLVGLGGIGSGIHAKYLNTAEGVRLVGVCDVMKDKADAIAAEYGADAYYDYKQLLEKAELDAVVIAVPHFDHPSVAIEAFGRGIHVLCEKPIAVHLNDANRMLAAYEDAKRQYPDLQFGLMFQERTYPGYRKVKEMIESGELGQLTRATWIHTKWFRSQTYYDSGDWRATWAGEGGGILTNQCPHTLDMYQWLFGLPTLISGHAHIGKYHDIEVEDEVTAYFEHDNGMIGHLIVTTAEIPGTNRLEIIGEHGKLVLEEGELVFHKNPKSMLKHSRETDQKFNTVKPERIAIPLEQNLPNPHEYVASRFFDRLKGGTEKLVAEGWEGPRSLVLANGIMLSSFSGQALAVPFDTDAFEATLKELAANSKYVKKTVKPMEGNDDLSASFGSNG
ncbi:Gfo/Idh/MocA family oxidoreductase [Paenibacillus sp. HB172176]|uniref:Gfo/Idh/MocA family protein n=1 Tax=Paenibacillus sp. HB172176 TaxID=2493690 RepID=UPI00143B74B4|nr:Gfo/Idh/MocA family oxidoreductase [Paenibacillus sp. HB172176]